MERKIGEIFEIGGEWYQCIESSDCPKCDLKGFNNCNIQYPCSVLSRKDGNEVIFKKLEKVGEPYDDCGTILQRFKIYTNVTNADTKGLELHIYSNNTIGIEIKQIKEDMEENNNAKHSNSESIGKNLKPFDLEAAKLGKPVCTRDGRKARIICFDLNTSSPYSVIVAVTNDSGYEEVTAYMEDGCYLGQNEESSRDLMMLPEKKEGWVNVYRNKKGEYWSEQVLFSTKRLNQETYR